MTAFILLATALLSSCCVLYTRRQLLCKHHIRRHLASAPLLSSFLFLCQLVAGDIMKACLPKLHPLYDGSWYGWRVMNAVAHIESATATLLIVFVVCCLFASFQHSFSLLPFSRFSRSSMVIENIRLSVLIGAAGSTTVEPLNSAMQGKSLESASHSPRSTRDTEPSLEMPQSKWTPHTHEKERDRETLACNDNGSRVVKKSLI